MVLQEEVLRRQREQEEAQHRQEEERQAQEEALRRVEERRREDEERKQRDEFLRKQVSAGESPAPGSGPPRRGRGPGTGPQRCPNKVYERNYILYEICLLHTAHLIYSVNICLMFTPV